jgi:hypothetical protein
LIILLQKKNGNLEILKKEYDIGWVMDDFIPSQHCEATNTNELNMVGL